VFYVTAAVYTFGAVMYCILASGSIQPWSVKSTASHASEVQVELQLNGVDTLLGGVEHKPASERRGTDDTAADSLLHVGS